MNENNGFILKPEMYNQEEWYEMYKKVVVKYIVLKEDKEVLQSKIDKAIEYINKEYDTEPHELYGLVSADELLSILNNDKIQEIPQFKGTMEQLDELCEVKK